MKIGIMTFWWSETNYGQILQCYALQKYLQDAGHDAYLIRFHSEKSIPSPIRKPLLAQIKKTFNPINLYKFLLHKKIKYMLTIEKSKHPRNFEDFRNKHIKQTEKLYLCGELFRKPPEADMYIVGSDQVWNPDYLKSMDIIKAYFFDFGASSIKRMAYAASFGKEKLNPDTIKIITPLLKKIDYVSVREKSGLNICKQCGIDNAEWVPDPTLLLDADAYRALHKDEGFKKANKPYCFLYLIRSDVDHSVKNIHDFTCDWAQKKGMDVIYVTGNHLNDRYSKVYPTIQKWLYLIEHAEYVITDSYHGSIFSLLFKKKFAVIPRVGSTVENNSRLESLFELFQIENRYIDNLDFSVLDRDIDWQSVYDTLESIRSTSKLHEIIQSER